MISLELLFLSLWYVRVLATPLCIKDLSGNPLRLLVDGDRPEDSMILDSLVRLVAICYRPRDPLPHVDVRRGDSALLQVDPLPGRLRQGAKRTFQKDAHFV
jgi:hypothetical protein